LLGGQDVASECLECTVQGTRILVPTASLERVLELPLTAPPPLSVPWVAGMGLVGDKPLVVVSLAGTPRGPLSSCRALLLRGQPQDRRYGLLVEEVRSIRSVENEAFADHAEGTWPCPPEWLTATREGEAPLLKLEASAVASWLSETETAEEGAE